MAKTALITGTSEGIDYEWVKLFAKGGYDCVLVARNELKSVEPDLSIARSYHPHFGF